MMMRVKDFMKTPVHVVTPATPVWEAIGLMRRLRIRHLPVTEGTRLVGIVTWTDLTRVRPWAMGGARYTPQFFTTVFVRDVMTHDPQTVEPNTAIIDAARAMRLRKIGSLPVVAVGGLVAIITESDIFDAFVQAINDTDSDVARRGEHAVTVPQ